MNVSLTPALEKFISEKIKGGLYNSASEVIREALRLLFEMEDQRKIRVRQLNHEISKGLSDLDNGATVAAKKVFEDLKKKSSSKNKKLVK